MLIVILKDSSPSLLIPGNIGARIAMIIYPNLLVHKPFDMGHSSLFVVFSLKFVHEVTPLFVGQGEIFLVLVIN